VGGVGGGVGCGVGGGGGGRKHKDGSKTLNKKKTQSSKQRTLRNCLRTKLEDRGALVFTTWGGDST